MWEFQGFAKPSITQIPIQTHLCLLMCSLDEKIIKLLGDLIFVIQTFHLYSLLIQLLEE